MKALNLQKRTFGLVENGSWAPSSGALMREMIDEMREMYYIDSEATLVSAVNDITLKDLNAVATSMVESLQKR